jgi:hypothetical protein
MSRRAEDTICQGPNEAKGCGVCRVDDHARAGCPAAFGPRPAEFGTHLSSSVAGRTCYVDTRWTWQKCRIARSECRPRGACRDVASNDFLSVFFDCFAKSKPNSNKSGRSTSEDCSRTEGRETPRLGRSSLNPRAVSKTDLVAPSGRLCKFTYVYKKAKAKTARTPN